jgi:nucleotide-binding universal stress UspA family protein
MTVAEFRSGEIHVFEKILVPLDGSPLAEKALPYATFLAKREGGRLFLVRAVELWAATLHGAIEEELDKKPQAEAELSATASVLTAQGLKTEQTVYLGEAAGVIDLVATTQDVDLIVMSTHGRSGFARWAYGSVAERVLRSSTRPVLLVPAHTETVWKPEGEQMIILPVDGSAVAEQALQPATLLARALGAGITVLRVIEPPNLALSGAGMNGGYYEAFDLQAWVEEARPYAESIAQRLRDTGISARAETVGGYAAATIQDIAAARRAAAITMATHGRTGLARLAMGSVAMGVVQRATAPVLIVRPADLEGKETSPNAD